MAKLEPEDGDISAGAPSTAAQGATQLKRAIDLLDSHLGDTDPVLRDGITQEEIEDEYPVMAAMQILTGMLAAPVAAQGATLTDEQRKSLENAIHNFDRNRFIEDAKNLRALLAAAKPVSVDAAFQQRVQPWMLECFGPEISADVTERCHRLFEEAGEACQSKGMTRSEAHQLVDYTWDRPIGDPYQEVGGVMVTLAAFCLAAGIDMHAAGETELARIWTKVEAIRAKQAAKPKHSPLPEHVTPPTESTGELQ